MFKFIKLLLLLLCVFEVQAVSEQYKNHVSPYRQLRGGGRGGGGRSSSRSSSSRSSRSSRSSYYKAYSSYRGAFYGGRSYALLYVYYLPPSGYYQTGGYMSPLYGIRYYNGYGWNFYYNRGDYYATSVNAVVPQPPFDYAQFIGVCFFIIIICIIVVYQNKHPEDGSDSEHFEETVVEVVETRVEENNGGGGIQRKYTMGSQ